MRYLTVKETAVRWDISPRRVHQYCEAGRIPGAGRFGNVWAIPEDAKKPSDPRNKNNDDVNADQEQTGAVIMAAGLVEDSEQISPLMQLGGISVIKRMILLFQRVRVFPIVVITGYRALEIEQHLASYGVIFLRNENYMCSDKFESAKMGFRFLEDKCCQVFFTSVNVPMFTPDTLRKLMNVKGDIVIPSYHGHGGHPVLLGRNAVKKILEYQGNGGMRDALDLCGCPKSFLNVDDEGVLLNVKSMEWQEEMVEVHNRKLLHPYVQISIERGKLFFDNRAKLLLMLIQETKSVQNACRQIAMSRSKAWEILNQMEKELGFAVVTRRQGGSGGGKTELTDEGKDFLKKFRCYEESVQKYALDHFEEYFNTES